MENDALFNWMERFIFVKGYKLLPFAKNIGKVIGKSASNNVSNKHSTKLMDHAEQSAAKALRSSSKWAIEKKAEVIGDLIGNKIANAVAKWYAVGKLYNDDNEIKSAALWSNPGTMSPSDKIL